MHDRRVKEKRTVHFSLKMHNKKLMTCKRPNATDTYVHLSVRVSALLIYQKIRIGY